LAGLKESGSRNSKFERLPTRVLSALRPEEDLKELATLLNLPTLPKRIEGFDISNISGQFAVASMVHFLNGKPDRSQYRRYRIKGVTGQNDFACMAEAVRRRYTRLSKDTDAVERSSNDKEAELEQINPVSRLSHLPDLILIDGGKGQLGMAVGELEALGLSHIPVIGLAKEYEEIYRPGESSPLIIPHDKGALKLLQRVRDESHRFANTFNAQLRLKKISESVLDEFPGIGPKRKAMLLRQFGSIQRLKNASIEDIMLAPGFGRTMAEELQKFLKSRSGSSEIESS
jgi:excinuclease ABC subunit C